MRDKDIRPVLSAHLKGCHRDEPETVLRDELGICAGTARVDLAVINGELSGYEIKSDQDSLTRLPRQVEAYSRVLDRATLVATERHLERAREMIPEWWGMILVTTSSTELQAVRDAELNPSVDAFSIAQLLWREEALHELRMRGVAQGLSGSARHYVWLALIAAVDIDELRAIARRQLRGREPWPDVP
ncbi:MAG TPA: sce7726 family protein [Candidatus Dormibacteraeota bacterium]|nr:sce7726 family protein [Candidatus Dormibacteraeota bacterium]